MTIRKALKLFIIFISSVSLLFANSTYPSHMDKLIKLARKQNAANPFAAMIINNKTNEVLCTGVNQISKNPMFHGEVVAINNCVKKFNNRVDWQNTTLITTAEPCPMCMGAIIWAGISKVVYGTSMKTLANYGDRLINIPSAYMLSVQNVSKTSITGGILSEQTDKLFKSDYEKKLFSLIDKDNSQ